MSSGIEIRQVPVGHLQANCYIVTAGGHGAVIDPGGDEDRIYDIVDGMGDVRIDAVVLTHGHFDHVAASDAVADDTQSFVYAHRDEAKALKSDHGTGGREFGMETPVPLIDFQVEDGQVITAGELRFEVLHTPGHSPGSMCLLLHDGQAGYAHLFTGDTLFAGSIGRCDFAGGNEEAMERSLERLAKLPPSTRVYPGHGPVTTIERESAMNPFWPRD